LAWHRIARRSIVATAWSKSTSHNQEQKGQEMKLEHLSNPRLRALCSVMLAIPLLLIGCERTADDAHDDTAIIADTVVLDDAGRLLGAVRFPTSCTAEAQPQLERGIALLHHMTFVASKSAFLEATTIDPECAIAYWGAAMTNVHPLWPDTILPAALVSGQALLDKATIAEHTSARERGYIDALQAYYRESNQGEAGRLDAFLAGWSKVHEDNPQDLEASLFYALALVATAKPGDRTLAKQKKAGAIAEHVKAEIPQHPGAHHYIIHAYDSPLLAERALETARHYDDVAPENSHALHMTTHITTRRGLWSESAIYNRRAADAATDRLPNGEVSMHYLHALDYLAYAYLQQAQDDEANAVLVEMTSLDPPFQNHAANAYAFAAVPARLSLDRHDWSAAAEVKSRWPDGIPWQQYPHLVAIPEFARALGAAKQGDYATAEEAISELTVLQEQAEELDIAYDWGSQVAIQIAAAQAWIAFGQNNIEAALERMRQAAEMEAITVKNPVTPGVVLPARELYGDMLLETGSYAKASEEYLAVLARSPNRFHSLFGAGRAAELGGDSDAAAKYYQLLLDNCPDATDERPQLVHARDFLVE
jgi:tetratricopeptide (TPR) repeat protein